MKVLLTYTNTNQFLAPPPVGLAYLTYTLKESGHTVKILDFMYSKKPKNDLTTEIDTFKPDIIGFSIRNLDNQNMVNPDNPLVEVKEYISLSKMKSVKTVLGGTAFTTYPEQILEYMEADYGLAGQGEDSFPQFIQYLQKKIDKKNVPGLVYREDGVIIKNPFRFTGYKNKKSDWSLIDMTPYKKRLRTPRSAAVIIKSGCAFTCGFCNTPDTMGSVIIPREIDEIIYEIKSLKETHQINSFFFIDPCFNAPVQFAKDLLKRIIDEKLHINFSASIKPIRNCYDPEFFELYKKAGGYFTMLGIESLSERMIENYRVPYALDDIIQCTENMHRTKIRFGLELLFGGPGETMETLEESLGLLPRIKFLILTYAIGVRILPNTLMCDVAIKEGLIKDDRELVFPKYYFSKNISKDELSKIVKKRTGIYNRRRIQMLPVILKNLFFK